MENFEKLKSKCSAVRYMFDDTDNMKLDELSEIQEILLKESIVKSLNHKIEDHLTDLKAYEKYIAYSDKYHDQLN